MWCGGGGRGFRLAGPGVEDVKDLRARALKVANRPTERELNDALSRSRHCPKTFCFS